MHVKNELAVAQAEAAEAARRGAEEATALARREADASAALDKAEAAAAAATAELAKVGKGARTGRGLPGAVPAAATLSPCLPPCASATTLLLLPSRTTL